MRISILRRPAMREKPQNGIVPKYWNHRTVLSQNIGTTETFPL